MKEYQDLANAIIVQACKDYEEPIYRKEVENFIRSDWFKALTDMDGEILIRGLKKKVSKGV